jgi:hypothetical protein
MTRKTLFTSIAAIALWSANAAAQTAGGLSVSGPGFGQLPMSSLSQGGGASGSPLSRPTDVRAANPARSHQATDQQAIARIRGDAGYLAGFQFGQPLAASRQPPPPDVAPVPDITFINDPFIVNNDNSVVTLSVGDNNTSQQGSGAVSNAGTGSAAGTPATQSKTVPLVAPPKNSHQPATLASTLAASFGVPELNNSGSVVNLAVGTGNVAKQQVDISR